MTSPEEVRAEVAAWFAEAWDPDLGLLGWRRRLLESGWAVPSWPTQRCGRGLAAWADGEAHETIRSAGGVATPLGGGMALAAPTLAEHGSQTQIDRLLGPTITGELRWCQLFSEPGAGSDLAGLGTTATRDGDEWLVQGQKVWTTSADHADRAMLLARTDWDAPKHAGLTYFALDMSADGVELRPLRQMNGHASFSEVFLTGCRVAAADVIGEVGGGWRVARATLAHERSFATLRRVRLPPQPWGLTVTQAAAEAEAHHATYAWYPQRAGRADLLVERASAAGAIGDPILRQRVTTAVAFERAGSWTAARATRARELGRPPGAEGSLGKLAASELARRAHHAHTGLAGASAMLTERPEDPIHATVAEVLVSTPAQSIAGGTDQIQRNIVGERVLGLPAEPDDVRRRPFREVPRNG